MTEVTFQPCEKVIIDGANTLTDAELLSLFMGSAPVSTAQDILNSHSLSALLKMPIERLADIKGIGTHRATLLKASVELARRETKGNLSGTARLTNPAQAFSFFREHMSTSPHNMYGVVYLDKEYHAIHFETMPRCVSSPHPYMVGICDKAQALQASAVMMSVRRPDGEREPNASDRDTVRHGRFMLQNINVRLVDYIIVSDGEPVSTSRMGWL